MKEKKYGGTVSNATFMSSELKLSDIY